MTAETTQKESTRIDSNGNTQVTGVSTITRLDAPLQQQQSSQAPVKPDHIPEKFWDATTGQIRVDELAKSYAELEKSRGGAQEKEAQQTANDAAKQAAANGQQPSAIESAMAKASAELAEGGAVSEETLKAFEAVGIARHIVEAHAEGVLAVQSAIKAEVHSVVGDDDGWKALNEWAAQNLDATEQAALNERLGKRSTMKAALLELHSKYQAAMGSDGRKSTANSPASSGGAAPYKNKEEMMAAVRSPQYKSDPAFREQHARRIIAAERAGINVFM